MVDPLCAGIPPLDWHPCKKETFYGPDSPVHSKNPCVDNTAVIFGNVKLGDNVRIGPHSILYAPNEPLIIKPNTIIGAGTCISARDACVTIGESVFIGSGCMINVSHLAGYPPTGPVSIGDNTEISDLVWIGNNIALGKANSIGPGSRLEYYVTMGNGNRVTGAYIGVDPADNKFKAELLEAVKYGRPIPPTFVAIGNNNWIREGVRIARGTTKNEPSRLTIIGDNNLIMDNTHLGHDVKVGNNTQITTGCKIAGHVSIDDYAVLGGSVKAVPFARIGECAYIIGNTNIIHDVPPYAIMRRGRLEESVDDNDWFDDEDSGLTGNINLAAAERMLRQRHTHMSAEDLASITTQLRAMRHAMAESGGKVESINWTAVVTQFPGSPYVRTWTDFLREPTKAGGHFKRHIEPW